MAVASRVLPETLGSRESINTFGRRSVCFGTSLHLHPMPPRTSEQSCRPRVSDRTMVGNFATRLACVFPRTEGRRHDQDMKPQRGSSIAGPSLRGLWGRSATGHNGQAAKEKSCRYGDGAECRKNISGVPVGEVFFHLTSLYRTESEEEPN